ncbi:hypothetical protein FBU31_006604, partial [Coemansia sp. 'formosensis']
MSVLFELKPDWARIIFVNEADGTQTTADFHYFWLRHNCPCLSGCRHSSTKERLIDAATIPLEIRPLRAVLTTDDSSAPAVAFFWAPIATKDD